MVWGKKKILDPQAKQGTRQHTHAYAQRHRIASPYTSMLRSTPKPTRRTHSLPTPLVGCPNRRSIFYKLSSNGGPSLPPPSFVGQPRGPRGLSSCPAEQHWASLSVAHAFRRPSMVIGRSSAGSYRARALSFHRSPCALIQTSAALEPAGGKASGVRWRRLCQVGCGGRVASALSRSRTVSQPLSHQVSIMLYESRRGTRRAFVAHRATVRLIRHLADRTQGPSAASARHALAAEWIFVSPQPLKAARARARVVHLWKNGPRHCKACKKWSALRISQFFSQFRTLRLALKRVFRRPLLPQSFRLHGRRSFDSNDPAGQERVSEKSLHAYSAVLDACRTRRENGFCARWVRAPRGT